MYSTLTYVKGSISSMRVGSRLEPGPLK